MRRHSLALLALTSIVWMIAPQGVAAADGQLPGAETRAVLQISLDGAFQFTSATAADLIPHITVWQDGTVVFGSADGSIQRGSLPTTTVAALVDRSRFLYGMDDRFSALGVTDAGYSSFTIDTEQGRKTVLVYAFSPDIAENSPLTSAEHPMAPRLREYLRDVRSALPHTGTPLAPDRVVVRTAVGSMNADQYSGAVETWPKELVGTLDGAAAQRAMSFHGLGMRLYSIDGEVAQVRVMPFFPLLARPYSIWPIDGLPRHPAVTAYTDERYHFQGVSQEEVQAWYTAAMTDRGWRQTNDAGLNEQIWVRNANRRDPLIIFRFDQEDFSSQNVLTSSSATPDHPGPMAGDCDGQNCLLRRGMTEGDARSWYGRYLASVGWLETEPDTFVGLFTGRDWQGRAYEQLQLRYETTTDGTRVYFLRGEVQVPATGWPSPPVIQQIASCEATRGTAIRIAGRTIQLTNAFCVMQEDTNRVRIQVAYGRAYAEVDRTTGVVSTISNWPGDTPVLPKLGELVGLPANSPLTAPWPSAPSTPIRR